MGAKRRYFETYHWLTLMSFVSLGSRRPCRAAISGQRVFSSEIILFREAFKSSSCRSVDQILHRTVSWFSFSMSPLHWYTGFKQLHWFLPHFSFNQIKELKQKSKLKLEHLIDSCSLTPELLYVFQTVQHDFLFFFLSGLKIKASL